MRNLILIPVVAFLSASALADDHFYLGTQGTYQFWDESRFLTGSADDNSVQFGLNLGYEFAERYAAELSVNTNMSDFDADSYELNLYNFFSSSRNGLTPYIVAGLSQLTLDPAVARTEETNNVSIGFGVSRYLSDFLELKTDIRLTNALDDAAAGDNVLDLGLRAALNYHFGRVSEAMPAPMVSVPSITVAPAQPAQRAPAAPVAAAPLARTITVELEVLFEFNSATVAGAGDEMAQMAAALKIQPDLNLTLEGHTDSVGDADYNQSLSQRRVDAVKQALVQSYGAPENRITAIGYGETRPIADNTTAAGRAENRRVVGVITFTAQ